MKWIHWTTHQSKLILKISSWRGRWVKCVLWGKEHLRDRSLNHLCVHVEWLTMLGSHLHLGEVWIRILVDQKLLDLLIMWQIPIVMASSCQWLRYHWTKLVQLAHGQWMLWLSPLTIEHIKGAVLETVLRAGSHISWRRRVMASTVWHYFHSRYRTLVLLLCLVELNHCEILRVLRITVPRGGACHLYVTSCHTHRMLNEAAPSTIWSKVLNIVLKGVIYAAWKVSVVLLTSSCI